MISRFPLKSSGLTLIKNAKNAPDRSVFEYNLDVKYSINCSNNFGSLLSILLICLLVAALFAVDIIHQPNPIANAILTLMGRAAYSDIAQDFYGFRALVLHLDPYPPLAEGFRTIGVTWDIQHASTHPPTAYLLTAPIAFLPFPIASAIWGWFMLAAIIISLRQYDLSWIRSICISIFLVFFWPPASFSLGQLTPLWLLGLVLAYKNQEISPIKAGFWIGIASLTKFFPALLLIPLLLRRKWSALLGFGVIWIAALLAISILSPDAISRYIEVNRATSIEMINRLDNGAFFPVLQRQFGWWGLGLGFIFIIIIGIIDRWSWSTWNYLAVVLLPVAWIYSFLPLLPEIIKRQDNIALILAFMACIVIPPFGYIFGLIFPYVFLLYGFGFVSIPHTLARIQSTAP